MIYHLTYDDILIIYHQYINTITTGFSSIKLVIKIVGNQIVELAKNLKC